MNVKSQQTRNIIFLIVGVVIFIILLIVLYNSSSSNKNKDNFYSKEIKNAVDSLPSKDLWIERSASEIKEIKKSNKSLEDQNKLLQKRLEAVQNMIVNFGQKLNIFGNGEDLKVVTGSSDSNGKGEDKDQNYKGNEKNQNGEIVHRELYNNPLANLEEFSKQKGYFNQESEANIANIQRMKNAKLLNSKIKVFNLNNSISENFIFAGTYAKAVLLGSVTVSAGINASANPKPVLLRISDFGNLPNKAKGFLKDAVVIGAAYGNLSSESVVIRLERIVKIDKRRGLGIDIPVKGYVAGENGDSEIRGTVFDRSGAVVRGAAVAGFFSGMASYLSENRNSVTFEPQSGLAQFSPERGRKMMNKGLVEGMSEAANKYADFIIKRAEQLQPVIKLDGGRKLTIVFTESVKASLVNMKKVRRNLYEKD